MRTLRRRAFLLPPAANGSVLSIDTVLVPLSCPTWPPTSNKPPAITFSRRVRGREAASDSGDCRSDARHGIVQVMKQRDKKDSKAAPPQRPRGARVSLPSLPSLESPQTGGFIP